MEQPPAAGQRVLALAACDDACRHRRRWRWTTSRRRFTLLGLVGLIDPPREEAIAAVAECQRAGLRVKMITGDHAVTAAAIGRQLGLSAEHALTGETIETLDDAALQAAAPAKPTSSRAPAPSTSCAWSARCRPTANWSR